MQTAYVQQLKIFPARFARRLFVTLRREAMVKLTPGPINFLILKNGLNFYRQDCDF